MGYMGFGLQRWIYTQKPRQFLSKSSKSIHSSIQHYESPELHVYSGTAADHQERYEERMREIHGNHWKRIAAGILSVMLTGLSIWAVFVMFTTGTPVPAPPVHKAVAPALLRQQEAYDLLIHSADYHLNRSDFIAAYEELTQAGKLFPKRVEHQLGFAKLYSQMCGETGTYCAETKAYVKALREAYPDLGW